jgi:hypothetical protein
MNQEKKKILDFGYNTYSSPVILNALHFNIDDNVIYPDLYRALNFIDKKKIFLASLFKPFNILVNEFS